MRRPVQTMIFAACFVGCGPGADEGAEDDEEACPAQPRICELFTFVREDSAVVLRSGIDKQAPAPPSDVHCVLEAVRDGTPSSHRFTDGFPSERYGDTDGLGYVSGGYRIRDVRVFEDGHVELIDSATEGFPDPATPEPRRAHFAVRADDFFDECLAATDAEVLRDCLWGFEAEEVPESGCQPSYGVQGGGGGGGPTATTGG